MKSPEKISRTIAQVEAIETTDPAMQGMLGLLSMVPGSMLRSLIPSEPDTLDSYLLALAQWSLAHRSDDAPPVAIDTTPKALSMPAGSRVSMADMRVDDDEPEPAS